MPASSAIFAPRAVRDRIWTLVRADKDRTLGEWVRARGAAAAFELAQGLLDQVWPRVRAARAEEDLKSLIALRGKLARGGAKRR